MVTSYLLSSTLRAGAERLAAGEPPRDPRPRGGRPARVLHASSRTDSKRVVDWTVAHRRKVVLAYLLATGAVVVVVGSQLGRELFPRVDAGQFQLRVRPPQGTHYELTRKVAQKTLDVIAEEVGPENVEITMGYAGANPPQFTINMAYLWSRGPDDSLLRIGLREGSGIGIFELQETAPQGLAREGRGVVSARSCSKLGLTPAQVDQPPRRFGLRLRARRPDLARR